MKNTSPASALDGLLRQSLAVVMRTRNADDDVIAHLWTVLAHLARFYQPTAEIDSQSVIEPAAAIVEVNGRELRCPRLLVQCMRRDALAACPLTFLYTPTRTDTIALHIVHGQSVYEAPDTIQWIASHKGWCIAGSELDGAVHAQFLRRVLYEAGLFRAQAMTLEPLHG